MGQIKTLTALVLTVVFVQACIMEDRSNCPAYLTLDFSETPELVQGHSSGKQIRNTV